MPARFPPLLEAGISEQICHGSLDLAPQLVRQNSILMREIHRLEIFEETIEEGAEPNSRNRIQVFERLQTAEINLAELSAVVEGFGQVAPLHSERIHRREPAFLRLLADLSREINKGRDSDQHGR